VTASLTAGQQLAQDAGYRIDWRTLDPEQNIDASRAAHRGDNQPLRALLAMLITTPEHDEIARLRSAASPRPARSTTPTRSYQPPGHRRDAPAEGRSAENDDRQSDDLPQSTNV
jgi:hypothetical protein